MSSNPIKAFDLPKMRMSEKWDFQLRDVLNQLITSKLFFCAFQDGKGDFKVLHSALDDNMYALMQVALHRSNEVHDFMKLSLINAEKFREGEWNEAYALMTQAVEYITIKNSKNLNL